MRNTRNIIAVACAAVALILIVGAGAILYLNSASSGQGNHPTSTNTATPSNTMTPNTAFKGIYVFSGKNSSAHSTDPYIAGTNLMYYWSQLEPQKGQYNWSVIDNDMKPWVDNGKSVILRVSTAGRKVWQPPYSQSGTPKWVYDMGVPSVTETDTSVLPQYWNPTFLQALTDFMNAFAAHYDGNAHVSFIEVAVGMGGETEVDTFSNNPQQRLQLWQTIGYTDQIWLQTVQKIMDIYSAAFHKTPLALMPDGSFIGKTKGYSEQQVVDYAVSHNLWLQDNGLVVGQRPYSDAWHKTTIVAEQRNTTAQSGDTLEQDIQSALDRGAAYVMVFVQDIDKSGNVPTLQKFAAMAH